MIRITALVAALRSARSTAFVAGRLLNLARHLLGLPRLPLVARAGSGIVDRRYLSDIAVRTLVGNAALPQREFAARRHAAMLNTYGLGKRAV